MATALELARAAFARGDFGTAIALARGTAPANPQEAADALALIANAAIRGDDLETAVAALEQLITLFPDNAALRRQCSIALNNQGSRLIRTGESHAAAARLTRALAMWPENVDALFNRARQCLEERQYAAALEFLRPAARLKPADAAIALELAECELACGDVAALARVERALDALPIGAAEKHARRARALLDAGRFEDAAAEAAQSATFEASREIAAALLEVGAADAGRDVYASASRMLGDGAGAPGLLAFIGSRIGLPSIHASRASLDAARRDYSERLERLESELDTARLAHCEPRLEQLQWTNYLLAYHGADDRALQARYAAILARGVRAFAPEWCDRPRTPAARARPRIGLVSSGFCHSTVGSYFGSWIGGLAGAGFEIVAFQLGPRFDDVTAAIGRDAHALVKLDGDIASAARAIREAELDLVIYTDPMVDPRTGVLAALRLAPRQATAWGFPVTTGLDTLDAFISCAEMEPVLAAAHYVEPLLTLPGIGTEYRLPPAPAKRSRAELGLPDGTLYVVPQAVQKLHPDGDAVFARIAALDRDARVLFFSADRAVATRALHARLSAAFAGADPARQLVFLPPVKRSRFLEVLAACDVMVDCPHWSGGNTTLDALRAGLPIVGAPGGFMRGRQTLGMLRLIGLDSELMVESTDALAAHAVALAQDGARRERVRAAIADGLPRLAAGHGAIDALAGLVRGLLAQPPR